MHRCQKTIALYAALAVGATLHFAVAVTQLLCRDDDGHGESETGDTE